MSKRLRHLAAVTLLVVSAGLAGTSLPSASAKPMLMDLPTP